MSNARRKKERRLDCKGRLFIDRGGRAAHRNCSKGLGTAKHCPGVGKNLSRFVFPLQLSDSLLLPNKVCFGPKRYVSVMGDFLCHADIG